MSFYYVWAILFGALLSLALVFLLFIYGQNIKKRFYNLLYRNFYFLREYYIEYWALSAAVIVFFVVYFSFYSVIYALLAVIACLFLLYLILNALNQYIQKKIVADIPFFLRLLAAALQSGLSMQSAITEIVQSWQGPLRKELSLLLRELQVGVSLAQALQNLRQRLPAEGIEMMTLSLEVAIQSGGSVAPLLHKIADNINQKVELEHKISALSMQGKLQAYVLTAVPYLLLVVLYWLDKDWVKPFKETLLGHLVLGFCVLMSGAGFYLINKMVKIKV